MASVKAIRDGLKSTIAAAIPGLNGYDTVADSVNLPAFVVVPASADFNVAMGRGADTHNFDVYVLTSWRESGLAQDDLDDYVTGAGAKSIRQAVFNAPTLGLTNTHAHVSGMRGYGARFDVAEIEHVGAILTVSVLTSGTA